MHVLDSVKKMGTKAYVLIGLLVLLFVFSILNQSIYTFSFINLVLMLIIASVSWDIMYGQTGYLSFAHSTPFGIGAYVTAILMLNFGFSPFLTAPLGGLLAMAVAVAIGLVCLRLKGLYFAFGTIFTNTAFLYLALVLPITQGALGIHLPIPPLGPLNRQRLFYVAFLILAIATIILNYVISRSKFGLGCTAIREDESACEVLGINTTRLRILSYALSSLPQGIMGGLYAYYMLYIDPVSAFGTFWTLNPVLMTIVGGSRTIIGPILGSIILFFLQEVFRYSIPIAFEGLHMMIFAALLMAVILFLPQGIIPTLKKKFKALRFLI